MKLTIDEALTKGFSSNHNMKEYNHGNQCCICEKEAKWHKNGVGLFCKKHKRDYQKEHKKMKNNLNADLTEADYQTWA